MANSDSDKKKELFDEWIKCIRSVSDENNADIFIISGGMQSPADENVIKCVEVNKKCLNALLILTTFGGNVKVAYRIARCFQRAYKDGKFIVFVHDICMSAGTLITVGADELIMADIAQLGPLDVQLIKPDEFGEMISGLTPVQSLTFLQEHTFKLYEYFFLELIGRSGYQITTKTSSEIATKLTTGMFAPIYSQLDPMRLGEYHRNMMVAAEYGNRLNTGNLKSADILKKLTHGYPSHDFIIDRIEAELLFKQIRIPNLQEKQLIDKLTPIINKDLIRKDERGYYVATVNYLDPNAKLDDEDSAESEENNNEKNSSTNIEVPTSTEQDSRPDENENNISDSDKPKTDNAEPNRTENDRKDTN